MLHVERFYISTVYIIRMSFSASNNFIIVVTLVVLRVCVCVPVRSLFLPKYLGLLCFYGIYSTLDIVVGMMPIWCKSNYL